MSKYEPLLRHLKGLSQSEAPMTFAEVERVLGFGLPPSARKHPAWWSNNEGTHVGVKAWRRAGRRTSQVDVPSERVVFVRDRTAPEPEPAAAAGEGARIVLTLADLPPMIRATLQRAGGDLSAAALALMTDGALERKRRLFAEFARNGPADTGSSVDLIREDRDGR